MRLSAHRGKDHPNFKHGLRATKIYKSFKETRRYFKKLGNGGTHTLQEWQELKKFYNYMCLCCKLFEPEIKLTEDHVTPVSLGGNDNIGNIQPLCQSCNSIKFTKNTDFRIKINK